MLAPIVKHMGLFFLHVYNNDVYNNNNKFINDEWLIMYNLNGFLRTWSLLK